MHEVDSDTVFCSRSALRSGFLFRGTIHPPEKEVATDSRGTRSAWVRGDHRTSDST